ncbi:MAG: glycosyl hydrolase, partial [Myxococcota bacterium]
LYFNGSVYALNNSGEWWAWTDGWYQIAGDPRDGAVDPVEPEPQPEPQPNSALVGGCGNCDGVDALRGFESYINRAVDYVLVWGWAQTAGDLMYAFHYLDEMWPASYRLHYSVPMVLSGGTFAQVYNGSLDDVYRDVARTIANRDPQGIIRIGHEMNGNWYDWSQDGPAGSSAEYAWAYQRLVNIFRGVSPDFKFVWNPGAGKWAGIDSISTYPGDAYVDYMSFDMYEDAGWAVHSPTDRWNHFLENDGRGLNWLARFAGEHGKAIAFDEWGSAIDDGVFITNLHGWIGSHNVAYQMYWHSNAAFPGGFEDHPVNAATYKRLFGR